MSAELEAALTVSRAWVATLDRTSLGHHAMSDELLAQAHASVSHAVHGLWSKPTRFELLNLVDDPSMWEASLLFGIDAPYETEVIFWWLRTAAHDSAEYRYADKIRNGESFKTVPEIRVALKKLKKLVGSPENIAFYDVGIWDDELIWQFMADGVDAEMASALVRG